MLEFILNPIMMCIENPEVSRSALQRMIFQIIKRETTLADLLVMMVQIPIYIFMALFNFLYFRCSYINCVRIPFVTLSYLIPNTFEALYKRCLEYWYIPLACAIELIILTIIFVKCFLSKKIKIF
jgi:hypothetical protein